MELNKNVLNFIVEQEPTYKATLNVTDSEALKILKAWSKANSEYISNKSNLQNVFCGLITYHQNGNISERVLNRIPIIFSKVNKLSIETNKTVLLSSYSFTVKNLASSFDNYFTNDEPIKFQTVKLTNHLLIERLQSTYDLWLERINEEKKAKSKNPRLANRLSESSLAKLLITFIPMFKTSSDDKALLCVFDFDKGIYDTNDLYLAELVDKLDPNSNERTVYNIRFKLILRTSVQQLEDNKYFYPVQNGIYDKQSKKLMYYSPAYRFISQVATPYVRNAKEPKYKLLDGSYWTPTSFIKSLSCNDPEIENLLYEVIDDSVNGNYSRGQAIFLLGKKDGGLSNNGSNGKGTFQDMIQAIVGDDNTAHLRADVMKERFAINNLLGKTVNIGDDLQANTYVDDSSNFNGAVTGDELFADRKNKKPVSFRFRGAMIQSTNEMPSFKNKTGGTYRRMVIVPFNAHYEPSEDGKNIKNEYVKTSETREWLLKKALEMPFFSEFTTPRVSMELMDDFKTDNDTVRLFVNEEMNNIPIARMGGKKLYALYRKWSDENGYKQPYTKQKFITQVTGILSENQEEIETMTMEQFNKIASNKDEREQLINTVLPIKKCAFVYDKRARNKLYSNFRTNEIEFIDVGQDRAFCFPVRELLFESLELIDSMPKADSPEFKKQRDKLLEKQSKLIK